MKNKLWVLILSAIVFQTKIFAQEIKVPGMCKPQLDSVILKDVKIEDAIKWSELIPPKIGCDNGIIYSLHYFEISIFTLNPLQTKEYGIGEGGVPFLAQNAIKKAKPGDTVILKNANYLDSNSKEEKLPIISFQLK